MKHLKWLGLLVVLAIVVVGSVALPASSQQPPTRAAITLFDPNKTTWDKEIDAGKGFSGDQVLFVDNQLDPETCERVGKVVGHLIFVKTLGKEDARFIGDFTVTLADGKITAHAAGKFSEFEQTDNAQFAVTGGTGAYRDVSGEVTIEEDVTMCERRGALVTIDIGPQG